jgi:hypothetical protein
VKASEQQTTAAARAVELADKNFEGDIGPAYWRYLAGMALAAVIEEPGFKLTQDQRDFAVKVARDFASGTKTTKLEVEAAVGAALDALEFGLESTTADTQLAKVA